jgi:predicted  nucleic acid-binding Zn-ribbon protein
MGAAMKIEALATTTLLVLACGFCGCNREPYLMDDFPTDSKGQPYLPDQDTDVRADLNDPGHEMHEPEPGATDKRGECSAEDIAEMHEQARLAREGRQHDDFGWMCKWPANEPRPQWPPPR